MTIRRITAATDLSPLSQQAVCYAAELAARFGAELHLLYVLGYPLAEFAEQCQHDFGASFADCEQKYHQSARERLAEVETAPLDEARVTRVVRDGFPVEEIPQYAEESGTDLLVLGTHGRTGLSHVLMGSVCEAVVRTARCGVFTVPRP